MPRFLLDTNCMIALVSTWHEHHDRALEEVEDRLAIGQKMVIAGPALVEAYAVLTRMPNPYRLASADAVRLLAANFTDGRTEIVVLDAPAYVGLLKQASNRGIAGGRMYDAIIAECALEAKVETLLTFNRRHLEPLAQPPLEIVVPG